MKTLLIMTLLHSRLDLGSATSSLIPSLPEWCPVGQCPCKEAVNDFQEIEGFECVVGDSNSDDDGERKSTKVFVEPEGDGYWYIDCNGVIFHDLPRQKMEAVSQIRLKLRNVTHLTLKDCKVTTSYAQWLYASLGITSVKEITLIAKKILIPLLDPAFEKATEFFPMMRGLTLKSEGIVYLSPNSLSSLVNLECLKILYTSVESLPEKIFQGLHYLQHVTMFRNTKLTKLPKRLFQNNGKITHLDLSMNRLTDIPKELLRPLIGLEYLDLGSNNFKHIPSDLLKGSCEHLEELKLLKDNCGGSKHLTADDTPCTRILFPSLLSECFKLKVFKYSLRNRWNNWRQPIEDKNHPFGDRVDISKNLFSSVSDTLEQVDIIGAKLTEKDLGPLFSKLKNLKMLDLSKNSISELRAEDIPSTVISLGLIANPFLCNCDVIGALSHLKETRNVLKDHKYIDISCKHSESVTRMGISEAFHKLCSHTEADTSPSKIYTVFMVMLSAICLILVGLLLMVCLSEGVRVWLYNHKFFSNCFIEETALGEEKDFYDLFISYAEGDSSFVLNLVDALENPCNRINSQHLGGRTFKCCIHERDWMVGEEIYNNIVCSVERSHRTVILLSRSFLHSKWCRKEFNEAYRRNKLILVLMTEEEKDEDEDGLVTSSDYDCSMRNLLSSHPLIQGYLKTYTYLKEKDPNLWKKLAYHLPHKKMPKYQGKGTSSSCNRDLDDEKREQQEELFCVENF